MECSIIGDSFRKTPPKGTPGARPLWLYRLFRIRMAVVKPSRPMPASAQRPRQRTAQSGAARRLASAVPNPPNGHRTIAAAHKRLYHPSNAYIFLDGNVDIDQALSLLDGEYLSAYDRAPAPPAIPMQAPVDGGTAEIFYELSPQEGLEGRARLAQGFAACTFRDREVLTALQILSDLLCGDNQAPLKRALLESGLAKDVQMSLQDEILQPWVLLEARDMAAEAAMQQKELCDISELLLGIECGGSDATSGIASNPAVGELSDLLVDLGASTMMSESIEWIGGEHVLAKRAAAPEIHNQIIQVCKDYEEHLKAAGQDCRAGQPTPGNKAGGLSTLDEKSLGCIRKGGTQPIVEVLEQAQRPTKRGAIVMDTAGYDISSVTSMVAGGCNAVIFTTGRGTPTGNAIVPVLKVTANAHTYQWMEDNMDVDLSPIITGEKTYQQCGRELLTVIGEVCSGKLTKAEAYGFSDVAVDHVCRFV